MIALITTSALAEGQFNRAVETIFINHLYGVAACAGSTAGWGASVLVLHWVVGGPAIGCPKGASLGKYPRVEC